MSISARAKLGLGGLFKGIENLIDLAAKLKESGGQISKEGEVDLSHLKEGMKGVFGFSVKTAVGGEPIVESFGNIKQTPTGPSVEEVREPLTDIFDEEHEIRILRGNARHQPGRHPPRSEGRHPRHPSRERQTQVPQGGPAPRPGATPRR